MNSNSMEEGHTRELGDMSPSRSGMFAILLQVRLGKDQTACTF